MHISPRTTSSPYGDLLTRMRCIGRIEILVFVRYRPGDPQQFSRRCAYSYLARLTRSTQTAVERFDHWIMLQRTQCRHIERPAQACISAVADAWSSAHAAPSLAQLRCQ